MSDIELELETEPCDPCILEAKEQVETPEKEQFSSDSEHLEYIVPRKNEALPAQTKEQKQKQNEEIVFSSCSTSNLNNYDSLTDDRTSDKLNHNELSKTHENHYFIDASSLLDESEISYTSLPFKHCEPKSIESKVTKFKLRNLSDQEFNTEFQKEIKVTNLEFDTKLVDMPSTSSHNITSIEAHLSNKNFSCPDESFIGVELESEVQSTSAEQNFICLDSHALNKNINYDQVNFVENLLGITPELPSTSSDMSFISLDSHLLNKDLKYQNDNLVQNYTENKPDLATSSEKTFASLDTLLNQNLKYQNETYQKNAALDKKTNFVRSGTFEIENDEASLRKSNEKRQGSLIFQNSIRHFSGHNLDTENMIPTTPFNSIIHINDNLIINPPANQSERPLDSIFYEKSCVENLEEENVQLPKSDTADSLASICESQMKRDDSVPIISGGILPSDCEIITKKTQTEDATKTSVKTAWVVDMSTPPLPKKGPNSPPEQKEVKTSNKSSLGFFVDFTDVPKPVKKAAPPEPEPDIKKNIFSMSIEFQAPKKGMPSRLSQSLSVKKQTLNESAQKNEPLNAKKHDSTQKNEPKKETKVENGVKSNIQFRHTRSQSNAHNRHSWNGQNEDFTASNHHRTYSLSEKMSEHASLTIDISKNNVIHLEQENEIICDIPQRNINCNRENSTADRIHKIEKNKKEIFEIQTEYSETTNDPKDTNDYSENVKSHHSNTSRQKVHHNDLHNNCQFEGVSAGLSENTVPNAEIKGQRNNSRDAGIGQSRDEPKYERPSSQDEFQKQTFTNCTEREENHIELRRKNENKSTNQTVIIINHDDIVINQIQESSTQEVRNHVMSPEILVEAAETSKPVKSSDGFVSLSDLDKPVPKIVTEEPAYTRMTRSIPETSWIENKLLMSRSIGCRPASKLLTNMSTSTPSFCFSNAYSKSSGQESDEMMSELSDFSSIQSSTALEISTEESFSQHHHSNRLGTDLLRMFLEEISPDVTVSVAGRRLKAHKCILSSRCQYFAAILSGGHVESSGNVISLDGFSFEAVYFAMCHIYSGAADIPESIDLVELATLADMLGLEGLKEVVSSTLKLKYCHMFHKPCSICVIGIIETLPLAFTYSLDDLYRKCLKWITRYFVRVWCTRAFASLSRELQQKCYQQHIVHMSAETVLETMLCVDKLLATLPNVRWAEVIADLTQRLKDDSEIYLMEHFASVLGSASFLSLGKELNWNISKLEGSLLLAAESLSPEQACRSYARINKLQAILQDALETWSVNFTDLVKNIYARVESSVVRQAVRVSHTTSWGKLDISLRSRVQELACLPLDSPKSQAPATARRQPRSTSGNRSLDLRQIRLAMQQHTRRAQSTETKIKKTQVNKPAKAAVEAPPPRPRTWPAQTQLKTKIISSSDSSRTSSPALKKGAKSKTEPNVTAAQPNPKVSTLNRPNTDKKISGSALLKPKSSVKNNITAKQSTANAQKAKPNNILRSNVQKVMKPTSRVTALNKENEANGKVSKSESSSSTQQSPAMANKNKIPQAINKENRANSAKSKSGSSSSAQQSPSAANRKKQVSSSNSTPSSQARSDSNPYSSSPSLRRSLLLAAKTPQVPVKPVSPATNKRLARIQAASNSLTSPTKASAAKCVTHQQRSKVIKQKTQSKKLPEKPTVERSGTFLKEEPTVLNKA